MESIFGNGNTEEDLERMMDWAATRKQILHAVNNWDELVSTFALLVDRADMTYPHFEKDAGAAILAAAKDVLSKIQEATDNYHDDWDLHGCGPKSTKQTGGK